MNTEHDTDDEDMLAQQQAMIDAKGKISAVIHASLAAKTAGVRTSPTATKAISKDDRPTITDRQDTRPTATNAIRKDTRPTVTPRKDTRPTAVGAVMNTEHVTDDEDMLTQQQAMVDVYCQDCRGTHSSYRYQGHH